MKNLNVIAKELKNLGFTTEVRNSLVEVSLNRFLGFAEVREALASKFGKISFKLSDGKSNNIVLVS